MVARRVVVVCGWMESAARPVDKYAQLYRKLGYDAVVLLSSQRDFLTSAANVHPKAAAALLPAVGDSYELIPHMLSNGGCRSWYCLENHLREAKRPFTVPAMIFDSSPSVASFGGFVWMWQGATLLPSRLQVLGTRAFLIALSLYPLVTRTTDVFTLHWQRFFLEQSSIPKLFLYSSSDKIVAATDVRAAMHEAASHGGVVEAVDFADSPHVSHYAADPSRYTQAVQTFLRKYLKK
ncbi:hypothetical protein ACHHYP_07603 [Achlya hypogyna]|uniref:Transmembrane protein 53 n=1 Tax=Achlya hypogyna TaxID=1202772 RepID=A0A1V9ZM82_ACHHY|nr:hypothetical protein ACHHYP_07603 [Achlya hypogyna]